MKHSLLLSFVSFLWAGSFVAIKIAVEEISPIMVAFLRFAIASPIMLALLFILKKSVKIKKKDAPKIIIASLTGVTLLYTFQFYGVKYSSAAHGGILVNANVLFIVILSAIFLKERLNLEKVSGVIVGFAGVFLIVSSSFSLSFNFGDILILFSSLSWAIYSVVGKNLMQRYDAITVTTYAFLAGTIFFTPFIHFPERISIQSWICIFYLAIFCSVFGYVVWYRALEKMEASKVAIYLNLIPLFSIILSFLILREKINSSSIAGAILIMIGIYLAEKG